MEVTEEGTVPEQNETKRFNSCTPHIIIHITDLQSIKQDIHNIIKILRTLQHFGAVVRHSI